MKRALVTGASRGIGRITALELAKKGFDLTLVARDRTRGEAVAREVKAQGAAEPELLFGDRPNRGARDRVHVALVDAAERHAQLLALEPEDDALPAREAPRVEARAMREDEGGGRPVPLDQAHREPPAGAGEGREGDDQAPPELRRRRRPELGRRRRTRELVLERLEEGRVVGREPDRLREELGRDPEPELDHLVLDERAHAPRVGQLRRGERFEAEPPEPRVVLRDELVHDRDDGVVGRLRLDRGQVRERELEDDGVRGAGRAPRDRRA
jgi:hypothetical protein